MDRGEQREGGIGKTVIQCILKMLAFSFLINKLTFQAGLNVLANKKNLEIRKRLYELDFVYNKRPKTC